MSTKPFTPALIIMLTGLINISEPAGNELLKSTQVHGFFSQGYSLTSDNNFYGDSQGNGSFNFREIAINASLRPRDDMLVSGQILSRTANQESSSRPQIDFLLLDYRFYSGLKQNSGVRLGRVKNPIGFYNETRDVAFTRPSIVLPQSIYFDRTRDLTLSSDGAQFYLQKPLDSGHLNIQLQIANPIIDSEISEKILLGGDRPGKFSAQTSHIAKFGYEPDGEGLAWALSLINLKAKYQPGIADIVTSGELVFRPRIFSVQYNTQKWSTTAEYSRRPFSFKGLTPYTGIDKIEGESLYIQGTYRFNDQWDAILRYDVTYTNKDDRNGRNWESTTGRPAFSQFSKDWTIGMRVEFAPSWMLRIENHWVNGGAWLSIDDNPDVQDQIQHWRLFTALISYQI